MEIIKVCSSRNFEHVLQCVRSKKSFNKEIFQNISLVTCFINPLKHALAAGDPTRQWGGHGEGPRPLPDVEPRLPVTEPQQVGVEAGLGGGGPGAQPELEVAQVVGGDVHGQGQTRAGWVAPCDDAISEHSPRLSLGCFYNRV